MVRIVIEYRAGQEVRIPYMQCRKHKTRKMVILFIPFYSYN